MHLLYVTESVPNKDPVHGDGSSAIPYEVLRNLPPDVRVDLVTFAGVAVPDDVLRRCASVQCLPERGRRAALAGSALTPLSVGGAARTTVRARRAVRAASRRADVTLLHGPHVIGLVHEVSGPAVFQTVDPWSHQVTMQAAASSGPLARYRRFQAARALELERRLPEHVALLTVGRGDAEAWSRELGRPVTAVPLGTDSGGSPWAPPAGPPTVCFVGSLDYGPNVESVGALVREIAPRIWDAAPETRFVLAGRRPVQAVADLAGDRVEVRANVPDVSDVFRSAHVAVFPDRSGLGMRNAVTEAVAVGIPVVASAVAAREQPAHPLLRVAQDDEDLVRLALSALTSTDAAVTTTGTPRTWADVAEDHLRACEEASRRAV
ncbi:glycosyltransferase [Kineococcus terrestris]|uniref:glycosyltransferase n=1 Tax=Kineococcus terrestris TaxID=2044856 RepID=UPI0034DAC966